MRREGYHAVRLRCRALVFFETQDQQGYIVGLRSPLGESGYGFTDIVVQRLAGKVGVGLHESVQAPGRKKLPSAVLRFRDTVGIGDQFVAAFQLKYFAPEL